MPSTTDYSGSFLGRISIRRNQITAVDVSHDQALEDLELFQKNVGNQFTELLSSSIPLLSISWLRKLLNIFLYCESEFKALVIAKSPLDRLIPELTDRMVKALDLLNAVTSGIEAVKSFQKIGEIVVSALEQSPIGEFRIRRAKKAMNSLLLAMTIDDKENNNPRTAERSWSFSRRGGCGSPSKDRIRQIHSQIAKNWSAAKQIQAMASNLSAPKGADAVYVMSTVIVFVSWALVAAIPCQDRAGLTTHFHFPVAKQLGWADGLFGLYEKIGEEWRRKEKKGNAGLLEEMQEMEKLVHNLIEFSGEAEKLEEVARNAAELAEVCKKMEAGLLPLQLQIREVFHVIVRSRMEFLEVLDRAGKVSAPVG